MLLKGPEIRFCLAFQAYHDKYRYAVAQRCRVDHRVIGFDRPAGFQRTHPAQAGRSSQADLLGQFDIGHPAFVLQFGEYLQIDIIDIKASHKFGKPFLLMRRTIIIFQRNAIVPLCNVSKWNIPICLEQAYSESLTVCLGFRESELRFNDQLHTILAKPPGSGGAITRWRQCVDILAQYDRPFSGSMTETDRGAILDELEALRGKVDERQRISTVVDIGSRLRSPTLVRFFGADRPSICAAAMARAQLPDGIWAEMIKDFSPTARGVLRHRDDMGPLAKRALASFGSHDLVLTTSVPVAQEHLQEEPAPTFPTIEDESQISRLVNRIEQFTSGREAPPPPADELLEALGEAPQPPPRAEPEVREFSFETDVDGVILWVKGGPRGQLIGMSISQPPPFANAGPDGHVAGAFRHRTAFRNARFTIEAGRLEGEWRMSAIPYFHQQTGRFLGYRGNARRPHLHEVTASGALTGGLYGSTMPSDSLRELIHELRTPLNAIQGFAEIIDHQLFGPVSGHYRALAQDIVNDARQLLGTFDDLDLATRIERGDLAAQTGAVDPAELVLSLAARFSDHGAAGRLDISVGEYLPPLRLDRVQAERMFQHLIRIVLSVAGPGEHIHGQCWYDAGHPSRSIIFDIDRPAALRGLEEADMFDPGYGPDGEGPDAPLLGIGFSLRLVRNLARSGSGNFYIQDDHFTLVLPAFIEAGESGAGAG